MDPLRLLVFDRTCASRWADVGRSDGRTPEIAGVVGLSTAWASGAALYRGLGRFDAAFGAESWDAALAWLATFGGPRPIIEIQYWGHGRWGSVMIANDVLDARALTHGHPLATGIAAVRERLVPGGEALVWLRTCESFGARAGLDFASRLADGLGARVAGHTHVIGVLQSGLHGLAPGCAPDWSAAEGIAEGSPEAPVRAYASGPRRPRTVTCFAGNVPPGWFAAAVALAPAL